MIIKKSSNEVKARLLGMPYGTANNKLKKLLLFSLVQQLKLDTCYRCNLKIETIETFSVEHKNGWQLEDNPIEAFFNIKDIGYSHLSCNSRAGNKENSFYRNITHCKNGHELNTKNTYLRKNQKGRDCKACRTNRMREIRKNKAHSSIG